MTPFVLTNLSRRPDPVVTGLLSVAMLTGMMALSHGTPPAPARSAEADISSLQSDSRVDRAIHRGVTFLLKRQGRDGSWASEQYGLLQSGQSITPLVLNLLGRMPDEVYPIPKTTRKNAFQFLQTHRDETGAVGFGKGLVADYPTYATALSVLAYVRLKPNGWRRAVRNMTGYLVRQQLDETHGWTTSHDAYGGWAMGRRSVPSPPASVHADVSRVRYVLSALFRAKKFVPDGVFKRARHFLRTAQRRGRQNCDRDGGLIYTPVLPAENKAGTENGHLQSYGPPTADGLLALYFSGADPTGEAVASALDWMKSHHRIKTVPGFYSPDRRGWEKGFRYYYLSAVSRMYEVHREWFGETMKRKMRKTVTFLLQQQKNNGRWENTKSVNRENDPIIATVFALHALISLRQ